MRFVCDSCRAQYMISDDKVGAKGVKVRCKKCGYVILVRKADGSDEPEESTKISANPFASEGGSPNPDSTSPGSESELSALAESSRAEDPAPSEVTNPGSPPPPPPDPNNVLGDLEDDEIGAVFDQVLKSGPHKAPVEAASDSMSLGSDDDLASTRVVSMDEIKKLAAAAEAKDGSDSNGTNGHGLDDANGKARINVPQNDWYVAIDDQQVGPLTVDQLKQKWDRGEIGPDSLCWRAGFSDWTALSDVSQLASVFAPRPAKPVIVAPAPLASSMGPVVSVPVESAFSAGGLAQSVRSEMPVMAMGAEPTPVESGSWKPSAASALASLAMQEVEALEKKPEPKKSAAPVLEPSSKGGLLDLPPPDQSSTGRSGSFNALGSHGTGDTDPRIRASAQNGFSSASAPFQQPSYSTYRPPAPPAAAPHSKTLWIALGGIGLVVVALAVMLVVVMNRQQPIAVAPSPQPPHIATNSPPMPPPPPGTVQTSPPPATASTATAPAQTAATAPSQPVASATPHPAATPSTSTTTPPPQVAKNEPPALRSGLGDEEHSSKRRSHHGGKTETASANEPTESAPPPKKSKSDDIDPFDKEFGGSDDADAAAKKKKGTGWIPPDPGSEAASGGKDTLSQGDILGVVLENKGAIQNCVAEQKQKDPGLAKGRMVLRWTILASGKTSGIQVKSDEFKSTYLATCISGLVKNMTFPKHRVQGPPIDFPFSF